MVEIDWSSVVRSEGAVVAVSAWVRGAAGQASVHIERAAARATPDLRPILSNFFFDIMFFLGRYGFRLNRSFRLTRKLSNPRYRWSGLVLLNCSSEAWVANLTSEVELPRMISTVH